MPEVEDVDDVEVAHLLEGGELREIPVDRLHPSGYNPNVMSPVEYQALKEDLEQNGLAYPLIVAPYLKGRYIILDGNHRFQAACELGWPKILCRVIDVPAPARRVICVRLNKNRGRLDPFRLAAIFEQELQQGLTQAQVGRKYGYAQPTVANILAAARLKHEVDPLAARRAPTQLLARVARIEDPQIREQAVNLLFGDPEHIPSLREGLRLVEELLEQARLPEPPEPELEPEEAPASPEEQAAVEAVAETLHQIEQQQEQEEVELEPEELEGLEWEVEEEPQAHPPPSRTTCPWCGAQLQWHSDIAEWEVLKPGNHNREE